MPMGVIAALGRLAACDVIVMVCGDTDARATLVDFSERRTLDLPSMRRVGLSSGSMKR